MSYQIPSSAIAADLIPMALDTDRDGIPDWLNYYVYIIFVLLVLMLIYT